ncbi:WhiB family transcriptional regulator [Mycolicibacterium farcinogenes]|nr:WhiB family transcriptional regulator [Mycolicibacterium farcinogenes]
MTWQTRAACANEDPALFFVSNGQSVDEAKAICAQCPVTSECKQWAIDNGELFGVWGGMTVDEITEARRDPETGQLRRKCTACDDWATGKSPFCDPCRREHRATAVARYDKKRREAEKMQRVSA